jgi:hypothetical protein
MCVTRAGCCQRLETQPLQIAGSPDVPWVWDDETASLVKCAECAAFFGNSHGAIPEMAWRRDNASNPHAIAINLAFVSDSGGLRRATTAINTRAASIFRHRVVIGMTCHLLFAAAAIRYAIADAQCHRGPPCHPFR